MPLEKQRSVEKSATNLCQTANASTPQALLVLRLQVEAVFLLVPLDAKMTLTLP